MSRPSLAEQAHAILAAARHAGAAEADVLLVRDISQSVTVRQERLEQVERAESTEAGLRVLVGRRQAVVAGSDLSPAGIEAMVDRALAMARAAPDDPHAGLATTDLLASRRDGRGLELADPSPEPSPEALQGRALEVEAAARAVQGVTAVDSASASWSGRELFLLASNGFAGGYRRTGHAHGCVAIAGQDTGMERDWSFDSRTFAEDLRPAAEIGAEAGQRAVARLGARKPPTGRFPVLFDERVAASLIGHLVAAANGQAVSRGASWLIDAAGKPVLPEGLDLIEEPLRRRGPLSRPFDAEGLATRPWSIVTDGRLAGYVLDLATSRKLGRPPTGNASRAPGGTPHPATTNLRLTQGAVSREDLIAQMGEGLLVTHLMGSTINPTTGDYSRGASGFWVSGGRISHPVHEATIAGNLRDFLRRIVPANDARPWSAHVVPSLLVEGLSVAGR